MTKVTKGAVHARASVTLTAAVAMVLVMATGACTAGAPVAPHGTAPGAASDGGHLFPLVKEAPSSDGTTVRRVGFVDESGRVVVQPTYRAHQVCPAEDGTDVFLAWGDGKLDALDGAGATIAPPAGAETDPEDGTPAGDTDVTSLVCGPLPGYATVGTDQGLSVVTLPDLTPSDLPVGVGLDASVIWVPATEQGGRRAAPYLFDASTGTKTTLPSDVASLLADEGHPAGTGEWPVPVLDTRGKRRYLDKTGAWASTQSVAHAGGFVHGHGWVSTGASWYFVDATLTKTGRDYTSIVPLRTADGTVTGYQVTSAAGGTRTGLVTVDLKIVVDPATESAVCAENATGSTAGTWCVVDATGDGTPRLVALPDGTSTPLPTGMTTVLSDRLVTDAAGSAVYNLTTGQTFAVPAPFRAETAWTDAYVQVTSTNGLRMVLDGTGAATSLGTITTQVTATDGTPYFWATTRSRQGYVDVTGEWLYHGARHTVLED